MIHSEQLPTTKTKTSSTFAFLFSSPALRRNQPNVPPTDSSAQSIFKFVLFNCSHSTSVPDKGPLLASLDFAAAPDQFSPMEKFEVHVIVHEAKKLIAADRGGTSDPYCLIKVEKQEFKTEIVKKSLSPLFGTKRSILLRGCQPRLLFLNCTTTI